RHQLVLPLVTLRTLLGRAVRQGYLRREGGRYFKSHERLPAGDLPEQRARMQQRQARLAEALGATAKAGGVVLESQDEALAMVLDFLQRYHVSLALRGNSLEPTVSVPAERNGDDKRVVLTAKFLRDTLLAGGDL